MRRVLLLATVLLFGFAVPANAQSTDPVGQAAAGLRGTNVYVASDSGQDITANEVQSLQRQIAAGRATIFIAVLPESASTTAGGVDGLPHTLAVAMGNPVAVFGVVSGHSFRAGAAAGAGLDTGQAGQFAGDAVKAHSPAKERLVAALSDFVTRVDNRVAARSNTGKGTTSAASSSKKGTDWGKIILIILGVLLLVPAIIVGIWLFVRKRQRDAQLARRRSVLKRRLEDLAGDVVNQESSTALNDNAKAAYSNAVTAYTAANSRFTDTATDLELDDVEHYVQIAESAMSDAKEYASGRDPHPPVKVSRVRTEPAREYAPADAPKSSPTQTTTVVNNYNGGGGQSGYGGYYQGYYPGSGYGYYPGYGWGYYGNNGGFVAGMLAEEMMEDRHDRDDDRSYANTSASSSDSGTSDSGAGDWSSPSTDSGSGDWGGSSPSYDPPSTDFGGGGDFGGGDSGGGGGGDW